MWVFFNLSCFCFNFSEDLFISLKFWFQRNILHLPIYSLDGCNRQGCARKELRSGPCLGWRGRVLWPSLAAFQAVSREMDCRGQLISQEFYLLWHRIYVLNNLSHLIVFFTLLYVTDDSITFIHAQVFVSSSL